MWIYGLLILYDIDIVVYINVIHRETYLAMQLQCPHCTVPFLSTHNHGLWASAV